MLAKTELVSKEWFYDNLKRPPFSDDIRDHVVQGALKLILEPATRAFPRAV